MGLDRRNLVLSCLLGALASRARPAAASIALALTLEELVGQSTRIWVGTPLEGRARWETTKFGRRIVTDSRVRLDRPVLDRAKPISELWLRTLGGTVGDVGQLVEGEARPALGQPCLLFLRPVERSARRAVRPQGGRHKHDHQAAAANDGQSRHRVVGMAQGLFRIRHDDGGVARLAPSRGLPSLIRVTGSAIERLSGRELGEAIEAIRAFTP